MTPNLKPPAGYSQGPANRGAPKRRYVPIEDIFDRKVPVVYLGELFTPNELARLRSLVEPYLQRSRRKGGTSGSS